MLEPKRAVIGMDGGGSYTRAMVCDLEGNILSYVETGSASIHKDLHAKENVIKAIHTAVQQSGLPYQHIIGLAAGIAGCDSEADLEWISSLTEAEGINCPRWHMNDAVAAHYGSFLGKPGIIAISGTGSIITAITEQGLCIRNDQYQHYASSAARFIAYSAVQEALAGYIDDSDHDIVLKMMEHWKVESIEQLYTCGRNSFGVDRRERDLRFGQFAPYVTDAAAHGSTLARRVCDKAVYELKVGIELLGRSFSEETVDRAFIGSVINSLYMKGALVEQLAASRQKQYRLIEDSLPPVADAVLYAYQQLGINVDDEVVSNLKNGKSRSNG